MLCAIMSLQLLHALSHGGRGQEEGGGQQNRALNQAKDIGVTLGWEWV